MKRAIIVPYEDYKHTQIHRAEKKWGSRTFWNNIVYFNDTIQETLRLIKAYPDSICCMGIRGGNEYQAFKEIAGFQKCDIYGVDISQMVTKVGPNCFAYDFAKLPKEWEKKFDWVYSNSIDHAYNIDETLKEWHRVCKGYILLTMSNETDVDFSDVYSFTMNDINVVFDKKLFEVIRVWQIKGADTTFNVLLKII
jgi:hypothetical protein